MILNNRLSLDVLLYTLYLYTLIYTDTYVHNNTHVLLYTYTFRKTTLGMWLGKL